MKNITLLLLQGLLFIFGVSCNQFLTKFHQNGYKIKDLRAELQSYNKKVVNYAEVKTFKYNRTTPAVNASFNSKIILDGKMEVLVQGYKFMSNEYRPFPIRFQVNIKKVIDSNAIGSNRIRNCGNITKDIYFEKNVTYGFCNFILDESRFPPFVPNGKFRFNAVFQYLNYNLTLIYGFFEIYTPIPYPKK